MLYSALIDALNDIESGFDVPVCCAVNQRFYSFINCGFLRFYVTHVRPYITYSCYTFVIVAREKTQAISVSVHVRDFNNHFAFKRC